MNKVVKAWTVLFAISIIAVFSYVFFQPDFLMARNITEYRDTISNSAPGVGANHTLSFTLDTALSPGSYIEVTPPENFEILATSTFTADRNVELSVNGATRLSSSTHSGTLDLVEIFPGSPGMIRYTLNTTSGISSGSRLDLMIGNQTSKALDYSLDVSTTTGTTTTYADEPPIINSSSTGTHKVQVRVYDGTQVADANFVISIIEQVGVGPADTREDIPPDRFNGSPTSTVTGVTLSVEIFVETNELAVCKFGLVAGVDYASLPFTFTNTGLIYHTAVVSIAPNTTQQFFVRCVDDEGNVNVDDYVIQFQVSDTPTGTANSEGDEEGDGTGSGNDGTGDGAGGGGETGESSGETPTQGGESGGGGSGGGGGGGTGGASGSTAGGGFESSDAPYRSGDGRVTMTGLTSPRSDVVILVDGKEAQRKKSDNQGNFEIILDQIARGVYTFGIYALDPAQNRSSTFSTSFTVSGARTSALSNITLPPSFKISPDPVTPGQTLTVSGYTIANAQVSLENEKEGSTASRQSFSASSDSNGAWSISVPTTNLSVGTYKSRARAEQSATVKTNLSSYLFYGVGQAASRPTNADLNRDGKVNLVDFSILLFWWNTDGGTSDPSADINNDGRVNLVDFSILLFNWTG